MYYSLKIQQRDIPRYEVWNGAARRSHVMPQQIAGSSTQTPAALPQDILVGTIAEHTAICQYYFPD